MNYEFKREGTVLIVYVRGELDHHNAPPLRKSTDEEIVSGNVKGLVIDLSGLEMMDSSGIGLIMGRCRLMESLGGHVCVSGAVSGVKQVIALSGLCKYVAVCDSAKEAVKLLRSI